MQRQNPIAALAGTSSTVVRHASQSMCDTHCGPESQGAWGSRAALALESLLTKLRMAARNANRTAPLAILPRRVLVHIFEILELADRISVSQTCHALRDVSLRAPSLWNRFSYYDDLNLCDQCFHVNLRNGHRHSYPNGSSAEVLAAFIPRSAPELLNLQCSVDVAGQNSDMLRQLIATTLPRMASLWLTLFRWGWSVVIRAHAVPAMAADTLVRFPITVDIWESFSETFRTVAPHLRTLSISSPYLYSPHGDAIPEIPHDFLGGDPGSLTACRISGFALPIPISSAFGALTVFECASAVAMLGSYLDDLLLQMPRLVTLGLRLNSFKDDTLDSDHRASNPRYLRNVGIGFNGPERDRDYTTEAVAHPMSAHWMFNYFLVRGVRDFAVDFDYAEGMMIPGAMRRPLRMGERSGMAMMTYENFAVRMPMYPLALGALLDCMDDVTQLSLREYRLLSPVPPFDTHKFPSLRHMVIICDTCDSCRRQDSHRLGIPAADFIQVAWECPVLEELTLVFEGSCSLDGWSEGCCRDACMTPEILQLILSKLLRATTPRPAKLALLGIMPLDDNTSEMLSQFAEIVETSQNAVHPEFLKVLEARECWSSTTAIFDPAFFTNTYSGVWDQDTFPRTVTRNTRHLFTDCV